MFVHMLVSVYNTNNNTASYTVVGCRGTTVCVCARLCHVGATLRSGDRNHYHLVYLVLFVFVFVFFNSGRGNVFEENSRETSTS